MPTVDCERGIVGFHVVKTGSSHTMQAMSSRGGRRRGGSHDSIRLHPWAADWTTFGTVRNPWDWYVSWWLHAVRAYQGGPVPGYGATFRDALRVATTSPPPNPGAIYALDEETPCPGGLWSWAIDSVYQGQMDAYIPTDRLNEGLSALLGVQVEGTANTHGCWPRPSDHYADWYDDEMIEWVASADADLIACFEFEPFAVTRWHLLGGVMFALATRDDVQAAEALP